MSDLIESLRTKSYDFCFFQAVNLLEEYFGSNIKSEDPLESGRIRFSANPEIVFPSGDIRSTQINSGNAVQFYLSFMGLLGISSPLPHYFTEYGAKNRDDNCALVDFLNIFDHRMYTLFYKAWKKYRIVPTWAQSSNYQYFNTVSCLSGLVFDRKDQTDDYHLLSYAGLFATASHNSDALAEVLSDCLGGADVNVEQWAGRWAEVENVRRLGVNLVAGNDAMLGGRIFDRSGKIRIIVNTEHREEFAEFLSGSRNISLIKKVVRSFSPQPLEFDIEVRFTPAQLVPVVLGRGDSGLGITASCGETENRAEQYSIALPG